MPLDAPVMRIERGSRMCRLFSLPRLDASCRAVPRLFARPVRSIVRPDSTQPQNFGTFVAIASMTGFARAAGEADGWAWSWELKSVNGRGLDLRCRLPVRFDR